MRKTIGIATHTQTSSTNNTTKDKQNYNKHITENSNTNSNKTSKTNNNINAMATTNELVSVTRRIHKTRHQKTWQAE